MGEFLNILVCIVVIFIFVCFWGKLRRKMAYKTLQRCISMIEGQQYKEAVRQLQTIGNDLKFDGLYWAYVAAAFAGAGAKEEAAHALDKAFQLDAENEIAKDVATRIKYRRR